MLSELRVSQLGVIEDLSLVFGPGMTALTGETGAGKTLVVEAVELLTGGRADAMLVRPGATEAVVEARFVGLRPEADESAPGTASPGPGDGDRAADGGEVVLCRVVPADGRSRAYLDGRMATVSALTEQGGRLVDLHGQHAHQSLLSAGAQRAALDTYAGVVRDGRDAARAKVREIEAAMARAGGDVPGRGRESELLRYQIAELDAAGLQGADEDDNLAVEEERLGQAASHRAAAQAAHEGLAGEEQVLDRLGQVVSATAGHAPLAALHERLRGLAAELTDAADEARGAVESLQEDPERLEEVVARRSVLKELRRKYAGPAGGLEEVISFRDQARARLQELEGLEGLAQRLAADLDKARAQLRRVSAELGAVRRQAAISFAVAVENELQRLAMPRARFEVKVGDEAGPGTTDDDALRQLAGEDVTFLLAANPGEPPLPLAKVASGGELARAMLAVRLVLLVATGGRGAGGRGTGGRGAGGRGAGGRGAGGRRASGVGGRARHFGL